MIRMVATRLGGVGCALLLACSSSEDADGRMRPTVPAGKQPAVDECRSTPLPLQLYPQGTPIVYAPFESPCGPVESGARVVLANKSKAPLRIEQVVAAEPFTASVENLPLELAPQERIVIDLAYEPTGSRDENGSLKISSGDGCVSLPLIGAAPDPETGAYMIYEPRVIDFGGVPAGSASEPATLVIHLDSGPKLTTTLTDFFVEPDEIFELVSAPDRVDVDGCADASIEVRFHAPVAPGFVAGSLGWKQTLEGSLRVRGTIRYSLLGDSE